MPEGPREPSPPHEKETRPGPVPKGQREYQPTYPPPPLPLMGRMTLYDPKGRMVHPPVRVSPRAGWKLEGTSNPRPREALVKKDAEASNDS